MFEIHPLKQKLSFSSYYSMLLRITNFWGPTLTNEPKNWDTLKSRPFVVNTDLYFFKLSEHLNKTFQVRKIYFRRIILLVKTNICSCHDVSWYVGLLRDWCIRTHTPTWQVKIDRQKINVLIWFDLFGPFIFFIRKLFQGIVHTSKEY